METLYFLSRFVLVPAVVLPILLAILFLTPPMVRMLSILSERVLRGLIFLLGLIVGLFTSDRSALLYLLGVSLFGLVGWSTWQVGSWLVEQVFPSWLTLELCLVPLLVLAGWVFCLWWGSDQVLFRERYLKPIKWWLEARGHVVHSLGRLRFLGRIIRLLEGLADRVNHRTCQIALLYLFSLSIFTLPVKLFGPLDDWVGKSIHQLGIWLVGPADVQMTEHPPGLEKEAPVLWVIIIYLFDWSLTVAFMYALVSNLARLLRGKDQFLSISEAVRYYVQGIRAFSFGGYFWRQPDATPTCYQQGSGDPGRWVELSNQLHEETERLDPLLRTTWQGINSRVAVVYEGKAADAVCVHYRRLGSSGFLVAVDWDRRRFDGNSQESQSDFQQLTASIGRSVNVRESLK
jgi:hypothetical protein